MNDAEKTRFWQDGYNQGVEDMSHAPGNAIALPLAFLMGFVCGIGFVFWVLT